MHKVYFKQAIHLLKADKVISIISILGTALAVTIVMTLIIVKDIKGANIAPEVNRSRSMYIRYSINKGKNFQNSGRLSINNYQTLLAPLQTPEHLALINSVTETSITPKGDRFGYKSDIIYSNPDFWKIFSFSFIEGRAFNQEEFDSGILVTVISEGLARRLFQTVNAIGKIVTIGVREYSIIGVVKDVSPICKYAYAQAWIPYTSNPTIHQNNNRAFIAVLLAKSKKDFPIIEKELRDIETSFNNLNDNFSTYIIGPFSSRHDQFGINEFNITQIDDPSFNVDLIYKSAIRYNYLLLIILLLIPAINLSSISLSKIVERTSEIGIRKAFGAKHRVIIMQVLLENFVCTLIGSIIGLVASIGLVNILKNWLFSTGGLFAVGENYRHIAETYFIPANSFVSPMIFVSVGIICLLLNLSSAGIPAYRASRQNIVDAIKK